MKERREIKFSYVTKRSLDKFGGCVDGKRVSRNGMGYFDDDGELSYVIFKDRSGKSVQYMVNSDRELTESKPVLVHARCYGKWFFKTVGYYWEYSDVD